MLEAIGLDGLFILSIFISVQSLKIICEPTIKPIEIITTITSDGVCLFAHKINEYKVVSIAKATFSGLEHCIIDFIILKKLKKVEKLMKVVKVNVGSGVAFFFASDLNNGYSKIPFDLNLICPNNGIQNSIDSFLLDFKKEVRRFE